MMRITLVSTLAVVGLTAQEKIDPRSFMVHDYTNVASADLALMRKLEIWDELEASALKLAFAKVEQELGFSLSALDVLTMTMDFPSEEQREQGARSMRQFVLQGNAALSLPTSMSDSYEASAHGAFTVYESQWNSKSAMVMPTAKMLVIGDAEVIKSGLDGKRKPGLPSADVMSLSAARGHRLAYLVADLRQQASRRTFLDGLFEGSEWPEGDEPTFIAGKVLATGDEDDWHVALEVVLRHAQVGRGVAASDAAIDALLKRGMEMPQLRLFHKILKSAEKQTQGSDVVVRVDLGRARDAIGNLAMVVAPLMMFGSDAGAAPVEVAPDAAPDAAPAQVEEPPPPPPAEQEQPAGGGGNERS